MATSAAQQTLIRAYCNDQDDTAISTTIMDNFYAARDSDFDKTVCDCLEYKIGLIAGEVDETSQAIPTRGSRSQRIAALERALARWQKKAGLSGGKLTTGILDMQLDYEDSAS